MISHGGLSVISQYFLKKTRTTISIQTNLFELHKDLQAQKLRFRREACAGGCDGRFFDAVAPGRDKARFLPCDGWK